MDAFAHRSQAEAGDSGTAGMQSHFVVELRPRKLTYLQDVMQKLDEVIDVA